MYPCMQVIYSFRSTVFEQVLLSLLYVAGIVHCSYTFVPACHADVVPLWYDTENIDRLLVDFIIVIVILSINNSYCILRLVGLCPTFGGCGRATCPTCPMGSAATVIVERSHET